VMTFDNSKRLPLVSVIVTTYNRAKILSETLDSILQQSFTDFELIVVDNMSEDGTDDYISSLQDPRIHYFKHLNHGIISTNRNLGIMKAVGKYIAFCDDDDLWMPDKLEKQINVLQRSDRIGLCYTNASSFCEDEVVHEWMMKKKVFSDHFRALLNTNYIPTSSVVVVRSAFSVVGLFDEKPMLVTFEDYEMWLRVTHRFDAAYIDETLIKYRFHKTGNLGLKQRKFKRHLILLQLVKDHCGLGYFHFWFLLSRHFVQHIWRGLVVLQGLRERIRSA